MRLPEETVVDDSWMSEIASYHHRVGALNVIIGRGKSFLGPRIHSLS